MWVVPIALPAALYASEDPGLAFIFALTMLIVAPGAQMLLGVFGAALPRVARLPTLVVIASGLLAVVELLLQLVLGVPAVSDATMVRALAVSGVVIRPEIATDHPSDTTGAVRSALGLAAGFALGLAMLTAIRAGVAALGVADAGGLPIAFLILAAGHTVLRSRDHDGADR